jgi:hypothetical protein
MTLLNKLHTIHKKTQNFTELEMNNNSSSIHVLHKIKPKTIKTKKVTDPDSGISEAECPTI